MISCGMSWRREEGIRSREQVVAQLDVTCSVRTSSEERGLKQVRPSEVRFGRVFHVLKLNLHKF